MNDINSQKIRGFEIVSDNFRKFPNEIINLPKRSTVKSAGYDFFSNESIEIQPNEAHAFFTDIKAYMLDDEVLSMYPRSSIGIKKDLRLKNTVGKIDADYFENVDNDGNIILSLKNTGKNTIKIEKNERIAQGIFTKYLKTDNDEQDTIRIGGIGSTSK